MTWLHDKHFISESFMPFERSEAGSIQFSLQHHKQLAAEEMLFQAREELCFSLSGFELWHCKS